MSDDKREDSQRTRPEARLISREQAEAAARSGAVVGRQPVARNAVQTTFPTVIGDEPAIDLRKAESDGDLPEDATAMPHWTEPATGEVPVALGADEAPEANGPRWRASNRTWQEGDEPRLEDLGAASRLGDEPAESAGQPTEIISAIGKYESFAAGDGADKQPPGTESAYDDLRAAEEPNINSGGSASADAESAPPGDAPFGERFRGGDADGPESAEKTESSNDDKSVVVRALDYVSLTQRSITAAAFAIAALVAFAAGPVWVLALGATILLLATAEYFDALRRVGYRPATILGILAVAGLVAGAYARGEAALPLVLAMSVVFTFLWYLTGVIKVSPTANIAVTLLGIVWIGVLGSYSALLLRMPERHGMAFLIGAVLVTIAYDTAAYVGGSMLGRHKLSAAISPNKSWEGLVAGTVAAVVVGALGVSLISPWSVLDGLLLGVVVSLVAPLGDLAESMIKRDLGLKDMGRILPGHGGVLDRFDAMLLVFPATYYLVLLLNV